MMGMPDDAGGTPSHWLVYFTAEDADAAAKRIAELGETVMVPPMGIASGGRICVARDPQGVVFALFEGETDGRGWPGRTHCLSGWGSTVGERCQDGVRPGVG